MVHSLFLFFLNVILFLFGTIQEMAEVAQEEEFIAGWSTS